MTRVYLTQHAKAYSKDENPSRPLTPEGEKETAKVANFLSSKELRIDNIFHSGKTRAEQTANIFAKTLAPVAGIRQKDGLKPLDDVTLVGNEINENTKNHMYVGHLPHMEKLTSYLLNGNSEKPTVKFNNAGIVCLEKIENNWMIQWIVIPDLV